MLVGVCVCVFRARPGVQSSKPNRYQLFTSQPAANQSAGIVVNIYETGASDTALYCCNIFVVKLQTSEVIMELPRNSPTNARKASIDCRHVIVRFQKLLDVCLKKRLTGEQF